MTDFDPRYEYGDSFLRLPKHSPWVRRVPLTASLLSLLVSFGMFASATVHWREKHHLQIARRDALKTDQHQARKQQQSIQNSLDTQELMREQGQYTFSQVIVGGYFYTPGLAPPPSGYINYINPHHPTKLFDMTGFCIGIYHKQRLFFIDDHPTICKLSVGEIHDY